MSNRNISTNRSRSLSLALGLGGVLAAAGSAHAEADYILVAEDRDGRISVLDRGNRRVLASHDLQGLGVRYGPGDAFAVADVTGDGADDVILADGETGRIQVYRPVVSANGVLVLGKGLSWTPSGRAGKFDKGDRMAAGDIDGDGKAEVVIGEDSNGWIDAYRYGQESPLGSFRPKGRAGTLDKHDGLAVGDVIGDRRAEVIVAEDSNGEMDVYVFGSERPLTSIRPKLPLAGTFDGGDVLTTGRYVDGPHEQIIVIEDDGAGLNAVALRGTQGGYEPVGGGRLAAFDRNDAAGFAKSKLVMKTREKPEDGEGDVEEDPNDDPNDAPPKPPAPTLRAISISGPSKAKKGKDVSVSISLDRAGFDGAVEYEIRLSEDDVIDESDELLFTGETTERAATVKVTAKGAKGKYRWGLIVKPVAGEADRSDNAAAGNEVKLKKK